MSFSIIYLNTIGWLVGQATVKSGNDLDERVANGCTIWMNSKTMYSVTEKHSIRTKIVFDAMHKTTRHHFPIYNNKYEY